MKTRWTLAALLGLAGITLTSGSVHATPPTPGVATTILAKSTFDELNIHATDTLAPHLWRAKLKTRGLSDVYVVDNKFAPGADTGWHSHPGPSLVFVVAGTVTNYTSSGRECTKNVYTAGSNFVDAGGSDVHLLRNEGAAPAETIAVQLLPNDAARRIDEPAPVNCSS